MTRSVLLLYDRGEEWQDEFKSLVERSIPFCDVHKCSKIGELDSTKTYEAVFIHASNEPQPTEQHLCCRSFVRAYLGEEFTPDSGIPAQYAGRGELLRKQKLTKAIIVLSGNAEEAQHVVVGKRPIGCCESTHVTQFVEDFLLDLFENGIPDYDILHGLHRLEPAYQVCTAIYALELHNHLKLEKDAPSSLSGPFETLVYQYLAGPVETDIFDQHQRAIEKITDISNFFTVLDQYKAGKVTGHQLSQLWSSD